MQNLEGERANTDEQCESLNTNSENPFLGGIESTLKGQPTT